MSRKRQMIEVTPPVVYRNVRPEKIKVGGFTCPVCNGNGWNWSHDDYDYRNDWVKKTCDACDGRGSVEALVTIEWRKEEK